MTSIVLPRVRDDDDGRVSRFDVERLAVGELRGADKERVEAAIAADAVLKAFYDEVKAADAAFVFEVKAARVLSPPALQARPSTFAEKLRAFFTSTQLVASLCAAAAVVVIVNVPVGSSGEGERLKGGAETPSVGFFVLDQHGDGEQTRLGRAGEALRAGDRIQLAVKDVAERAMVVVGVDGSGAVSVYAREAITSTTKGANSKPRLLPASLVLDDAIGAERFFVVYGDDLDTVEARATAAAKALADDVKAGRRDLAAVDRLDVDAPQSSVHIVKVR